MNRTQAAEAVIFDMDNTLLQSRIDFAAMKRDTLVLLTENGLLPVDFDASLHSTVMLLEQARLSPLYSPKFEQKAWRRIEELETAGMENAKAEPGALELLEELHSRRRLRLLVLTNNAEAAARKAVSETGLDRFIDGLFGREQAGSMKPAPDGMLRIVRMNAQIPPDRWLSVGDSWIDGKAAADAGLPFVAYRSDRDDLHRHGVEPLGRIEHLSEVLRYVRL